MDLFTSLSNWGRWGADDELGTLNLITSEQRRAAAALVREGRAISLAHDIDSQVSDDGRPAPQRLMLRSGERLANPHRASIGEIDIAEELVMFPVHGVVNTHLDALSHYFWRGMMWNDKPAQLVTTERGATVNDVRAAAAGIFTRGILIDVPRLRRVDWLEGGEGVGAEDLLSFEASFGLQIGPGDALLLRTGQTERLAGQGHPTEGPTYSGWLVDVLPLLHERGVSLIGSDGPNDTVPSGVAGLEHPIHQIGLIAMGLWIIDNLDLRALSEVANDLQRPDFCLAAAPLRFAGSTGSLINPIAVF